MIYARMMRNEVARKLGALTVVFAFIVLSALLLSSGAGLIVRLGGALDRLFAAAETPHVVQMHAGELDRSQVEAWAASHELVSEMQLVEMITIDGSSLLLPRSEVPESGSVMDTSFVVQNEGFDHLLGPDDAVVRVEPGTIGVPVYYAAEKGVRVGDRIRVSGDGYARAFTVADIIRDSQMNPAMVHSKRFLVNPTDYRELRTRFAETEYLIEFRLSDPSRVDELSADYQAAGLPSDGPMVDRQTFRLLNGISDGIVAAVVIILSLLLMLIAVLCLRFTILATIEEDYREIGVMKAVGMPRGRIKAMYVLKYLVLGAGAAALGYLASFPLTDALTANMLRYTGEAPASAAGALVPAAAAAAVLIMVYLSARVIVRRFNRISAVQALRAGQETDAPRPGRALPVRVAGRVNLNVFLGVRDALMRFRLFGLLTLVFFFAAAITLVPLHFLTTMRSPEFVSYMGVGRADVRIDVRQTGESGEPVEELIADIEADADVEALSVLTTSTFTLHHDTGETERFAVETGDLSVFPLDYLRGRAPVAHDEIALSHLRSEDLGAGVGETLVLSGGGTDRTLTVTGIYQDITNGGRTAKATFPHNEESIIARTINLDLAPGVSKEAKVREYGAALASARVTDLDEYLSQTLGNTMAQLSRVTGGALALGVVVAVLITSLFFRMLIAKDARRIAIMQSIGFSTRSLRVQYTTSALVLLLLGVGAGTLFSNTLGQRLVSFLWGFMGAARIEFVVDPLRAYVVIPLLLAAAVAVTTLLTIAGIRNHSITAGLAE